MSNAKRKKKLLRKKPRQVVRKKTRSKSLAKRTRRRVVVKNAKGTRRRVKTVVHRRRVTNAGKRRPAGNRKGGRLAGRKVAAAGRSVAGRKTGRKGTGKRRSLAPAGVVENYRENFFTVILNKGSFSNKLDQVRALPLDFIERYSFHPQYQIAIKLFATLTGKDDASGGVYFYNQVTPFNWVALPRNVRKFLVRLVQLWSKNYAQRKESGVLDLEKDYDRASKPNNLKEIKVTFVYTKGAGGYGES